MNDISDALADYRALIDSAEGAHLATLGDAAGPEASYAPCAWHDGDCYLFLSALSSHTANLRRDPRISLMLLQEAGSAPNPFARQRVSLRGKVETVDRESGLSTAALAEFHRRFGEVMRLLESLPDFTLFRIELETGSFVRGFGQAYALEGEKLDRLRHLDPRN
ncbi:MAG TPA: pyridoxamine 5'-phosphate oxidase family protein [Gammaproteobacteria bacterium]